MMGSTIQSSSSSFAWNRSRHAFATLRDGKLLNPAASEIISLKSTIMAASKHPEASCSNDTSRKLSEKQCMGMLLNRRSVTIFGLVSSLTALGSPGQGLAFVKQGPLAGRIPGLSEPDENGWRVYRRPDEKSGGHGVGWSPIIPYSFAVPNGWEEVPVSIADLGGTEIDLRYSNSKEGSLFVIVAPVLRFADNLGDDATIEKIGTPEKVISAFGPEVIGENVEGKVISSNVIEHSGRTYYQFELEPPHVLITATAAGNRLYLFNVTANGLKWKRHYQDLKRISESFRVV